jgi:hypothetical protein
MKPKKYPTVLMTSKTLFSLNTISALPNLISHFPLLLFSILHRGEVRWREKNTLRKSTLKINAGLTKTLNG